jgi:hypothetical protein
MRKTKKILLEEQAARLDAKQILARDFSPDIHPEENFWQPQSFSRKEKNLKPPVPTR